VSASAAERMVERLPRGRLVTVPRSGHAVMSDNPTGFNRALGELLRQERC
jgi:pimeloyl-ACP methyl ester carboxylesterase